MTGKSDDILSVMVKRLAARLDSEAGASTLALMQKIQLLFREAHSPDVASPEAVSRPVAPGLARVGIWEADGQGGFARSKALAAEWRCWADVPILPPKGHKKRIVLLGESVARGYLYDPLLTPSIMLERMLGLALPEVEVIDLARIDVTRRGLAPLLTALPELAPDGIVLFAGNNWHTAEDLTLADLERVQTLLPRGWDAVRRHFVDIYLPSMVEDILDKLALAAGACRDVPVVVVVPEFNLRDWQCESSFLAPVLPRQRNLAWLEILERAERAAREDCHNEVEQLAQQLIELDGGTSAISQRLLAESLLAKGCNAEALAAFEAARDAPCGLPLGLSPRCTATIQQALRVGAASRRFDIVNLPQLLREAFGGAIPDRRSFLDYCHLTVDGLRVAMSATAERLLPRLGAAAIMRATLASVELPLSCAGEATAHVLAAVHNAHYGQSGEILLHHCRRALALSPTVADEILGYLDFQGRRAPRWMCRSFIGLAHITSVQRYLASTTPNSDDKFADHVLCQAMAQALDEKGWPGSPTLASIMDEEHGREQRVDLLAPAYSSPHKWIRDGYERELRPAYLRASGRISLFLLPRAHPEMLRLRITWRIPDEGGVVAGSAALHVNGHRVADLGVAHAWNTTVHDVAASLVHAGMNRVEIHWPAHSVDWGSHVEAAAARLERGARPEAMLVLGEIHAFTAEVLSSASVVSRDYNRSGSD